MCMEGRAPTGQSIVQGWLKVYSSLDFGGGDSVHIASGVSGLVAAMILGKRHDYGRLMISHWLSR